jgi:hypothetical protein
MFRGQQGENEGVAGAIKPAAGGKFRVQEKGIARQAHAFNSKIEQVRAQDLKDGRVHVEMEMAIHMIHGQPGFAKALKLCGDFGGELHVNVIAAKKIAHARAGWIVREIAIAIDEFRNRFVRKGGGPADEREVQADAETRIFFCEGDGFIGGFAVHHQAGGGEDAALVGFDDGAVDGVGTPEIISVHDEATAHGQLAP